MSITASANPHTTHARNFLVQSLLDPIEIRPLLARAAANVISEPGGRVDIDLSPERLTKSTMIDLIRDGGDEHR